MNRDVKIAFISLLACLVLIAAAGAVSATDEAVTQEDNATDDLPVDPIEDPHPGYEAQNVDDDTEEMIELGKMLYFDPRISETGTISCNTCHNVMEGGDDSRQTAMGVHGLTGPVASPTVWNSGFHHTQFWDGRADTLAEQAEGPIVADVEMGMPDHEAALDRVRAVDGYTDRFEDVFGDEEVNLERVTEAIAAYERTLVTDNSPFDQYARGDADAMTEQQIDGMETFQEVGCQSCHSGPMFSGQWDDPESGNFHGDRNPTYEDNELCEEYIEDWDLQENDGRMGVTGDEADQYVYKTPTLRNVEHTAPYLHTGQAETLEETIRMMGACQLDTELEDEQVEDIHAFLTALTGEYPEQTMPQLPNPSGESMIPMDAMDIDLEDAIGEEVDEDENGEDDGLGMMAVLAGILALALVAALATIVYMRQQQTA